MKARGFTARPEGPEGCKEAVRQAVQVSSYPEVEGDDFEHKWDKLVLNRSLDATWLTM